MQNIYISVERDRLARASSEGARFRVLVRIQPAARPLDSPSRVRAVVRRPGPPGTREHHPSGRSRPLREWDHRWPLNQKPPR